MRGVQYGQIEGRGLRNRLFGDFQVIIPGQPLPEERPGFRVGQQQENAGSFANRVGRIKGFFWFQGPFPVTN
jgi:hypothetical protein